MKKLSAVLAVVLLLLCCTPALSEDSVDWLKQYEEEGYTVVRIPQDTLYNDSAKYAGQAVVTTFVIEEKGLVSLKTRSTGNEQTPYGIIANFTKAEIAGVEVGQSITVIGVVDDFDGLQRFGNETVVRLKNCHLVEEDPAQAGGAPRGPAKAPDEAEDGEPEETGEADDENLEDVDLTEDALDDGEADGDDLDDLDGLDEADDEGLEDADLSGEAVDDGEADGGDLDELEEAIDELLEDIDLSEDAVDGGEAPEDGEADGDDLDDLEEMIDELLEDVDLSEGGDPADEATVGLEETDDGDLQDPGEMIDEDLELSDEDEDGEAAEDIAFVETAATGVEAIMPTADMWDLTFDEYAEIVLPPFGSCTVGNKQSLRVPDIEVGAYLMDGYYVFGPDAADSLSKIAFLLSDSQGQTTGQLNECVNSIVSDMTDLLGEPDTRDSAVAAWQTAEYTVQIGTGKFKNYTGSEDLNVGIFFTR